MKDLLLTEKPFYEKHEIVGTISTDSISISNLQIFLQFSKTSNSKIEGIIIGTKEKYPELDAIFHSKQYFINLQFVDESITYRSSKVFIEKINLPSYETMKSSISKTYDLAIISLHELFIINKHRQSLENISMSISYFLQGPEDVWDVRSIRSNDCNGNVEIITKNTNFELDDNLPYTMEISPYYFYDNDNNNIILSKKILSFNFKMKDPKLQILKDVFIESTHSTLEIILALASFISKTRIDWYRYNFYNNEHSQSYIKRIIEINKTKLNYDDYFIEPAKKREFFYIAYMQYKFLKAKNFNLFMPIMHFISGYESQYLEEKFTNHFLSLEFIKDLYSKEKDLENIINLDDFKKIKGDLKKYIKSIYKNYSDSQRDMVYKKIGELNRPSLKDVLTCILNEYSIDINDLYPENIKFTIIETRNELFHTSNAIQIKHLSNESKRLEILLERIILKLLGWNDLSWTINTFLQNKLTEI